MRRIGKIIFIFLLLFLCKRNVFAYSKYDLEDFVFFDPVTTQTCDEKNYWTYYNQNTTCYRFIVLSKNDNDTKSNISLLLDHNLGVDTFNNYSSVLSNATANWTRYSGTIDIPSEEFIADLMMLGNKRPTVDANNVHHDHGILPTMYTNVDFFVDGVQQKSGGYWLKGDYSDNSYAYSITQYGSNAVTLKTNKRGIRPMITLDKSLISGKTPIINISVPVRDNSTEHKYKVSSSYSGYNRLQGFTVANGALTFYAVNSNDTQNGLIISYNGNGYSSFRKEKLVDSGHGNGMTYIPEEKKILVVGANDYKDIHQFDSTTLNKDKVYNYNNESYNSIGYDRDDSLIVVAAHQRFYFFNREFNRLSYSTDFSMLKIGQDFAYYKGYIYAVAYENGVSSNYQIYYLNNEDTCKIHVINAKFKADGTPDKDFGRVEKVLYIGNIQRTARPSDGKKGTGEIEGINFYDNKVIVGYNARKYDSTYPFKFYEMNVAGSSFANSPNVKVSYNETDTNTKISIVSTTELKSVSGWSLSSDKYTLSKTVSDKAAATTVSVCDRYSNCGNTSIKALTKKKQTVTFTSSTVEKQFHLGSYTLAATSNGDGAVTYSSSDTSIATVDNNGKVTFHKVGQVVITAVAAKTSNYYKGTSSYVLNITKGNQTLLFDATQVNKSISDASFSMVANHPVGDGVVTYTSSDTNVATVDNSGNVTIIGTGTSTITATATATDNYKSTTTSYSLNVGASNQELSFSQSSVNKRYGDSEFTMAANHSVGDGEVTYTSSNTSVATVDNNGKVTIRGAGTTIIKATAAATASYSASSASYSLNVGASNQELSFSQSSVNKRYGDSEFTMAANHSVGDGAVTYASSSTSVATVDNNGKVTIRGTGSTIITATASATSNYSATSASYALNVGINTQEITFSESTINKKYGDSDYTFAAIHTVGDGAVTYSSSNQNVAVVDNTGKVTIFNAGTAIITAVAAETSTYDEASASYALNVSKASQIINIIDVSVNGIMKKIGDEPFSLDVVTSADKSQLSYSSSNPLVATIDNNGLVTVVGEGDTILTAIVQENENYDLAVASVILKVQSEDSNDDTTEEIIEKIPNTFLNNPFKFITGTIGAIMVLAGVICFIKFRKVS